MQSYIRSAGVMMEYSLLFLLSSCQILSILACDAVVEYGGGEDYLGIFDGMAVQLRVCCNETHLTSDVVLSIAIDRATVKLSFWCYNSSEQIVQKGQIPKRNVPIELDQDLNAVNCTILLAYMDENRVDREFNINSSCVLSPGHTTPTHEIQTTSGNGLPTADQIIESTSASSVTSTEVLRQFPETTAVTPASETTHEVQMTSGSGLPPTDQDDESSGLEESSSADSVTGTEVQSQFPVTTAVIIALVLGAFCLFSVTILAIGIQYYMLKKEKPGKYLNKFPQDHYFDTLNVEIETKISLTLSMDTLVLPIGNYPSNKYSPEGSTDSNKSVDYNGENASDECGHFTALETTHHATLDEDTEYHNVGDLYMLKCKFTTKDDGKEFDDIPLQTRTNSPSDDSGIGLYNL